MPTDNSRSTRPVGAPPSREQVRAALDVVRHDRPLTPPWQRTVANLQHDVEYLIGLTASLHLLRDNHDMLAAAGARRPAVRLGVFQAEHAVTAVWCTQVYGYARRAQAALEALAAGTPPDPGTVPPRDLAAVPDVPPVALPANLAARLTAAGISPDVLTPLRTALHRLTTAERHLDEPVPIPDQPTGPDEPPALQAARRDEYLAHYADTVAWTLVADLHPLLAP